MKRIFLLTLLISLNLLGQENKYDEVITYKKTESRDLKISFMYPQNWNDKGDFPLIIFYHGGGWIGGNINQFDDYATYFAKRGTVCALVQYRLQKEDNADPFTSLADAKSAIRFLKTNAKKYHIDAKKIIAAGGSAGGQLAAACELVDGFNDAEDNRDINTKVAALVLFNPVIDNGPNGYGYNRIGEKYKEFSPFHQKKTGMADALIMVGTNDKHIPVQTMKNFQEDVELSGGTCDLIFYEGAEHGFFNKGNADGLYYRQTRDEMEKFLRKRNFLAEK